ncbi:MAG: hypothetical protein QW739_03480 [Candidatus Odinarchaeota archaeon]
MLSVVLIALFTSVSAILVYAVIKIPTVKNRECRSKTSECVHLEFYFKEFENKPNLFLKIINKSANIISNINGFVSITSREGAASLQPFKTPDIDGQGEFNVYLTALSRMTRYYVDVTLIYHQSFEEAKTKLISEIYLP